MTVRALYPHVAHGGSWGEPRVGRFGTTGDLCELVDNGHSPLASVKLRLAMSLYLPSDVHISVSRSLFQVTSSSTIVNKSCNLMA